MLFSLYQDEIVKSRIIWDRIMGWLHFIETGKADLPRSTRDPPRAGSSRCAKARHSGDGSWLTCRRSKSTTTSSALRKVHKRSTLRAALLRGDDLAVADDLLRLTNLALNELWERRVDCWRWRRCLPRSRSSHRRQTGQCFRTMGLEPGRHALARLAVAAPPERTNAWLRGNESSVVQALCSTWRALSSHKIRRQRPWEDSNLRVIRCLPRHRQRGEATTSAAASPAPRSGRSSPGLPRASTPERRGLESQHAAITTAHPSTHDATDPLADR